jgi:MoaA/NifB/PqqE/SkfB family radical SAM enzyme
MGAKYLSYELELEAAPTFPDQVHVESTNLCNADCITCPTSLDVDARPRGYMEWDLYTAIVDEIAPWAEAVVLRSRGEPLLHRRALDMIRYAKERDVRVEISTRATLLDGETSRTLLDAGLEGIHLGIGGPIEETCERIRNGRRADLTRAGNGHVGGIRKPCPNLWYHAHIHWDGMLVSCSRDDDALTPLGNVKDGGVLKAWHGARMRQMRHWHATGNFCAKQCVSCTEWSWWTPQPLGGGNGSTFAPPQLSPDDVA